ncbi:PaeR7I family type II restriction endonuclease [Truepera radiovictrix]|nr:PaeR7I family type II restriction endonuclease [Truepera radiovictrix]WMT57301.1 PaeR7I family type II restriction endonuclease [Truepera radiovictrix]
MALDLANYQDKVASAVKRFWQTRISSGDNRASVVQGKHLDGFFDLITDLATANGLPASSVRSKGDVVLPGYFRATKTWDVIVVHKENLIAAFEFKSQVGPSFGNNFNNRLEEAIGSATDLWRLSERELLAWCHARF